MCESIGHRPLQGRYPKKENKLVNIFSRVLCDSTPRFVGPSVDPSIGQSVGLSVRPSLTLYFFGVNVGFGLLAPAQMFH